MIDIEKFLISLRGHKDADGRLNPIRLADNVIEEIKIIEAAVRCSKRPWVGLTDADILTDKILCHEYGMNYGNGPVTSTGKVVVRAVEALMKEKNT